MSSLHGVMLGNNPGEEEGPRPGLFGMLFEGAAGASTLGECRPPGPPASIAGAGASPRVSPVAWGRTAADPWSVGVAADGPREGMAAAAFEGCAGMGTWLLRRGLQHAEEAATRPSRREGLATFADRNSCTRQTDDHSACPFGIGRNMKRQYPGAPVRQGSLDAFLFGQRPEAASGGPLADYMGLFEDTAGNRSWRSYGETNPLGRLPRSRSVLASSPDLFLVPLASSVPTEEEGAPSMPRPRVCRQPFDGGDMTFAAKHEVLEDFKERFSGSAGVSTWSRRPEVLARTSQRQSLGHTCEGVRAAGARPPTEEVPLGQRSGRRTARQQAESGSDAFHGAAGKPLPPNDWRGLPPGGRSHLPPPNAAAAERGGGGLGQLCG